ncbi:MAG: DUF1801 domain-containing protein [Alphaproteobacteria bacterium]|nr:DUF1801 domain-containing protein [Alphaproteobacteria bacterium]
MSDKLQTWYDARSPEQAEIARRLAAVIGAAAPAAELAVKWGHPTWTQGGPVCQLKPQKAYVGLVFWWGAKLPDPSGALTGAGDKMRTARFAALADIDEAVVTALVQAALQANATLGDPTKTKA